MLNCTRCTHQHRTCTQPTTCTTHGAYYINTCVASTNWRFIQLQLININSSTAKKKTANNWSSSRWSQWVSTGLFGRLQGSLRTSVGRGIYWGLVVAQNQLCTIKGANINDNGKYRNTQTEASSTHAAHKHTGTWAATALIRRHACHLH